MTKALREMLRGAGREMSVEWMHAACTTADNREQMHSQMEVLHHAAVHVLATRLYNTVVQGKQSKEALLAILTNDLRREVDMLLEAPPEEMTMSKPGGT